MQVKGTITQICPFQSGVNQQGKQWCKQQYIIRTEEQYPRNIAFVAMNDNITKFNIQLGYRFIVDLNVESHEYQGKWYTSLIAWRVSPAM